jgi:periplasmic protein TonB
MNSNASSWCFLLLISFLHLGGIAFMVLASPQSQPEIIEPSIQGILIAAPKKEEVIPIPPPPKPPEKKPEEPKKKLPKALPSERAVKAQEPEPLPPLEEVKEVPQEARPEPVVPPSADAQQVNNPAPAYPAISKKLKEEGTVLLTILVTKEGRVAEAQIKTSSGHKRLDDAAVRAIKRWKFNPATQAGEPVDYWYEIDFEFSLRKK